MNKPKLIVMVGNIVSGKTTWIKKYLAMDEIAIEKNNWVVLSKDDLRRMLGAGQYLWDKNIEPIVHKCFIDILCNFMSQNVNIILDETNMDIETRDVYLNLTKERVSFGYDYETIAVVMPKILREKVIIQRCQGKGNINWAKGSINHWKKVWQEKNDRFQMPTKEEGFDEILEIG